MEHAAQPAPLLTTLSALPTLPASPADTDIPSVAAAENDMWCDSARAFITRWTTLAQIHLAMNTLAALAYGRAYKLALTLITILTVFVGSKGVSTLIGGSTAPIDIIGGVAEVLLGITAGLLTNFELKAKSEAFHKRAAGYGRLAATLQVKTLIHNAHDAQDRTRLTALMLSITAEVQALEEFAEPLPLKYRHEARRLIRTDTDLFTAPTIAQSAAAGARAIYDVRREQEGNPAALIISQQI